MRHLIKLACLSVALTAAGSAFAATGTITPLATFGNGDGYRAPAEVVAGDNPGTTFAGAYGYLANSGDTERGLAYNPVTGHLLLVSRRNPAATNSNNIRILDSGTGADINGLDSTGITGGTFAVNNVGVGADGAIYVGNLAGAATTAAPYKIYRFANEAATSTVAFTGAPAATRIGDSFDVTGSGVNTRIVTGYNGIAGYAIYTTADGTNFVGTSVSPITGTAAGDFRYSDTFGANSSNVLGNGSSLVVRNSTYSGGTGTLANTIGVTPSGPLQSNAERLLEYAVVGTTPVLITQSTGDSRVRVYDATDLNNIVLLATSSALATVAANGNSAGQVVVGAITGNTVTIYALSTNQGIQAFTFTVAVPEPTTIAAVAGVGMLALVRRRRA